MPLRVKINGTERLIPLALEDITLRTYLHLVAADARMPKSLKAIVKERNERKRKMLAGMVKKTVYANEFLPFYAEAIEAAAGIPKEDLLGTDAREGAPVALIERWYWNIVGIGSNFQPSDEPPIWRRDGKTWTLPAKFMEKSTFIEFAEAAQYEEHSASLAAGNWNALPYVMAVIVRPEGEAFNAENIEARAEYFLNWTMADAMQVAFFLLKRSESLSIDSAIYSLARKAGRMSLASKS